jgi:hypothetical protein
MEQSGFRKKLEFRGTGSGRLSTKEHRKWLGQLATFSVTSENAQHLQDGATEVTVLKGACQWAGCGLHNNLMPV